MDDLISRQAAIDAVCMEWCGVKHQDCKHPFDVEKDDYYWCDGCETVLRTLPNLPPAQRKGKWVCGDDMFEYAICTSCQWDSGEAWEYALKNFKFCPHCGARMEKGEDDG